MRAIRFAAGSSAGLGLTQVVRFIVGLPAALNDWSKLALAALGLFLVGASVAAILRLKWARRVLVLLLWLAATVSASELALFGVLAWATRPWPAPHEFVPLVARGFLWHAVWLAVSCALWWFLRSERSARAYGS